MLASSVAATPTAINNDRVMRMGFLLACGPTHALPKSMVPEAAHGASRDSAEGEKRSVN
jgi:hypothetical protein